MSRKKNRHHGSCRPGLPQLQLSVPGPGRLRGRGLYRHSDPRYRRSDLPSRSWQGISIPRVFPFEPKKELETIVRSEEIDEVWFSYSDVPHSYVMDKASRVIGWGAHFGVCSVQKTMLSSTKPVIAVTAVRTGVGKSQTSRYISRILRQMGLRVVAVRHPMPYGDLSQQICQRFATYEDLDSHQCTIEEREEYEPHLDNGFVVYAGYRLREDSAPGRAGGRSHPLGWRQQRHPVLCSRSAHHAAGPSSTGSRADLLSGTDQLPHLGSADRQQSGDRHPRGDRRGSGELSKIQPRGTGRPVSIRHHGRPPGADRRQAGAGGRGRTDAHPWWHDLRCRLVRRQAGRSRRDRRPHALRRRIHQRDLREPTPTPERSLPAMGYGQQQIGELEATINATEADVVVEGTPINLQRILSVNKPIANVAYELEELDPGVIEKAVQAVWTASTPEGGRRSTQGRRERCRRASSVPPWPTAPEP